MAGQQNETRNHRIQVRTLFEGGIKRTEIIENLSTILCQNCTAQNHRQIKHLTNNYFKQFRKRWLAANRTKVKFLQKNYDWLENFIVLSCTGNKSTGRPKVEFNQLSYAGKYKRIRNLRTLESNELLFAAKKSLNMEGNSIAAKRLSKIAEEPREPISKVSRLSNEKALALIIDARLSKRQYQEVRNASKENNADIYPTYNEIREAKKLCYPTGVIANENSVCINLQSLLDHTTRRLLETLGLQNLFLKNNDLTISWKWGMDGSSGQKEYRQAFVGNFSDANLLLACVVPLELHTTNKSNEKIIIWSNSVPGSTKYCRPIKMQFLKETIQVSKTEVDAIKKEIEQLVETKYIASETLEFKVKHKLFMTMVDNKMISSLTDCSSQKCYLCGAFPNDMNKIDYLLKRTICKDYLQYGISSLHAWIRTFECLLKIGYRIPLQKWQARGDEKLIIKQQKEKFQSEFKTRLGIIVDQPKQGAGTSNDGNCARTFFRNYEVASEITGVNKSLIYRFYIILQVIASGFRINITEYTTYSLETARLFVDLYPWYKMPVSIHKILLHGSAIINASPVAIGKLTEEAQEARNKEYRRYREHNSRKCNRTATNIDVFNNLLLSSDPLISSFRKKSSLKKNSFCHEALYLFEPNIINGSLDDDKVESSSSDSD